MIRKYKNLKRNVGGCKSEKVWRTRLFLNNINPKMIVVGEGFEPS